MTTPKDTIATMQKDIAVIQNDIKYIKQEMSDIKRLEYWLLGLFASLFLSLVAILVGTVIK